MMKEASNVDHPAHYGGKDNLYEAIKVIEAWELSFTLGNAVKYISRAGKKDPAKKIEDIQKAAWYVHRESLYDPGEHSPLGPDGVDPVYHPDRVADAWELSEPLRDALRDIYRARIMPAYGRPYCVAAVLHLYAAIKAEKENPC